MELAGKVALVTGANRGIGAAIVDAFVAAGAERVYAAARSKSAVKLQAHVVPIELDITSPEQVASAAARCNDVHVLVNNAAISLVQPILSASVPDAAEREMRVNYFGTLSMCRAFAPILKRQSGSAIVNVLSILARMNAPVVGSYAASKAAALSLTQGIRGELARDKTLVVGVMPGFVDTDMAAAVSLPKLSPAAVADSIVDALRHEIEDVYPGDAANLAKALQHDPKAVEKQLAALLTRAAGA